MTDAFPPPSGDQPPPYGAYPPPAAPPYGAPQYGAPYGSPNGPPSGTRNGFGTAALILGILGLLGCVLVVPGVVLGILAVVFGTLGRGRAKRLEATNGGVALAGIITGAIGLVLSLVLVAVGVAIFNSDDGRKLRDCVERSTSQEQTDACSQEFGDNLLGR